MAGSLVFLFFGDFIAVEPNTEYLLLGVFFGILPDFVSYFELVGMKFNKWSHVHRDIFSHSIFFPLVIFIVYVLGGIRFEIVVVGCLAMLTHPILDLFGIRWGVKLFYPFSKKTFKMFYKWRVLTIWDDKEVYAEADEFGDDNWIRNIYFKPNIFGGIEWLSLISFLLLLYIV